MDPLSIAASIAGLLTAAGEVAKIVGPFVSAASEVPQVAFKVHSEVQSTRTILAAVNNLIINVNIKPLKHASLIKVDQIVTILTDGVLIFSELESAAGCLLLSVPTSQLQQLRCRLQWARKESALTALLARLESFKNSLSLILDILQYDSDLRAEQHHLELSANLSKLLESNAALSERLGTLEDVVDARTFIVRPSTIASTLPSTHHHNEDALGQVEMLSGAPEGSLNAQDSNCLQVSSFDFEPDLEASWVYHRAKRDTMDYSFRSSVGRSRAWSALSGLSLSEISIISVIALPISSNDLTNSQHYAFGNNHRPPHPSRTQPVFDSDRSLYHDCLEVKHRLLLVPGFKALFDEAKADGVGRTDLLNELRHVLQQGFPFLMLLNWVTGNASVMSAQSSFRENGQLIEQAVYEFLSECTRYLQMNSRDLFTMTDLMGNSYLNFMKVVTVLATFLTELSHCEIIQPYTPELFPYLEHNETNDIAIDRIRWFFQNTCMSFVREERVYIAQLQVLLESRIAIEKYDRLWAQNLDGIFGPISAIMNLQVQALLQLEINLSRPPHAQNWARPFLSWEDEFGVAYRQLIMEEENSKTDLVVHNMNLASHMKRDINDEYRGILQYCYKLLAKPRLRFYQYRKFLKAARTHDEYFRQFYTGSLDETARSLWQLRVDDATTVLNLTEATQSVVDRIVRARERKEVLQRLRSNIKIYDELEMSDLNKLVLFGRFHRTDVQDGRFREFFICLFPTILLWYTRPFSLREERNNSEQSVRITLAHKHAGATNQGTVSRRDITRIAEESGERGELLHHFDEDHGLTA